MRRASTRPDEPMRVFVVGTDTAVGKTAVTAALLHTARARGLSLVPFKPAQSGDDRPSDAERLLVAAGLSLDELDAACPLRYEPPLAPGLADDPAPFLDGRAPLGAPGSSARPGDAPLDHVARALAVATPSSSTASDAPLDHVARALDAWEERHRPVLTLVEGAGGLHVPMPGATWQAEWIVALAPWTLVVGRAGLGTINHCLSTIAQLRAIGRPPLGFVLSRTERDADPSMTDNAAVIAQASGLPCLGTLPHGPEPALAPELLDALLARLGR